MRALLVAVALSVAACTEPAPPSEPAAPAAPETPSAGAATDALLAVLAPIVSAEIGQPIRFEPENVTIRDGWAYVVGRPQQPDGAAIDWTTTALASRYEHGAMDTGGATHALLKQENGAWRVVTHVIAPTDVAWLSWPAEYGVPADVLGIPAE